MPSPSLPLRRRARLEWGAWLALSVALGVLLGRALATFAVGSAHVGPFDSDMAIPVLMSNGSSGWWFFDAYYYGQDRLGAWPYLLARAVRQGAGVEWTAARLQQIQACVALLAAVPLVLLPGRVGLVAAAAWALVAVGSPTVHSQLFYLGQPYAWQVLALCGAWAVLHVHLAAPRRSAGRLAALLGLSTLAVWTSPVSGPLLLWLLAVEVAGRWEPRPWREWLRHALPAALVLVVAMVAERQFRRLYHREASRAFGHSYRTSVRLDTGHLLDNARALAEAWAQGGWVVALVLAAAGVVTLLVLRRRAGRAGPRVQAPPGWRPLVLALGASGLAALNFAIAVAVNHVRLNGYHPRYLVLTHLMLGLAAAWVVLALLEMLLARTALARAAAPLLALGLLGAAHLGLPAPALRPEQAELERTAWLLQREPGPRLLLGGYWQSYVYAALARPGALVPLPVQGDYLRTPFDVPRLQAAEEVVANHEGVDTFGPAEAPHPFILQYGVLLRRVRTATPLPGFSLYARVDMAAPRVRAEPALELWEPCRAGARAALRFESVGPVEVLLHSPGLREPVRPLQAELAGRALPVEVLPGFYRVRVGGPVREDSPLLLTGLGEGEQDDAPGCHVRSAHVLPAEAGPVR